MYIGTKVIKILLLKKLNIKTWNEHNCFTIGHIHVQITGLMYVMALGCNSVMVLPKQVTSDSNLFNV